MASDWDRACQAVEYLHDEKEGRWAMSHLNEIPEELARSAFAFHERRPPQYFEIQWAAPKIAAQLLQGNRVVAFHPTGRFPLTWSVTTQD